MNRSRLTPDTMDPALFLFLMQLAGDTHIDRVALADFVRDNLHWLSPYFRESGEPPTHQQVENCAAIWVRRQFKQRQVNA